MKKVKQLADVKCPQPYINLCVREIGIDTVLLNMDKVEGKPVQCFKDIKKLNEDLKYSKFICAEPVTNGLGEEELKGIILYFMLENGLQKALYVYPGETEEDKLYIQCFE